MASSQQRNAIAGGRARAATGTIGAVAGHTQPLREQDLDEDPLRQFASWFEQAAAAGVREPDAAALASASAAGAPSLRMVLVKAFDTRGFVFFSGYSSRKGGELAANPRAALLFHWDPLGRQVRIEGPVSRTSAQETASYVRSRPRASQLSALASPQSQTIADRQELERGVGELERAYAAPSCRCRVTGAASAWRPRASSSGSSARIACTTGCATAARARAG